MVLGLTLVNECDKMSYCRQNEHSDVYVVRSGEYWYCHGCKLSGTIEWKEFKTRAEIHDHLIDHMEMGQKVPGKAIDRLVREMAENAS